MTFNEISKKDEMETGVRLHLLAFITGHDGTQPSRRGRNLWAGSWHAYTLFDSRDYLPRMYA